MKAKIEVSALLDFEAMKAKKAADEAAAKAAEEKAAADRAAAEKEEADRLAREEEERKRAAEEAKEREEEERKQAEIDAKEVETESTCSLLTIRKPNTRQLWRHSRRRRPSGLRRLKINSQPSRLPTLRRKQTSRSKVSELFNLPYSRG